MRIIKLRRPASKLTKSPTWGFLFLIDVAPPLGYLWERAEVFGGVLQKKNPVGFQRGLDHGSWILVAPGNPRLFSLSSDS